MEMSLPADRLTTYLHRQMSAIFPDEDGPGLNDLALVVTKALERLEHCLSRMSAKGSGPEGVARFNHRHSDQYATFLYFVANTAFKLFPGSPIAEKVYGLNKALHALDAFFEVDLPDIFLLVHPVGTVLGRAGYSDYFCCYQNVTVGSNLNGEKPTLGRDIVLFGGSRIIGKTRIGANSMVSTGAIVLDQTIPEGSVVFGTSPNNIIRKSRHSVRATVFKTAP